MSNFNPSFSKIGDILVHLNIISKEQLEKALSEQQNNNDKLGNILISQGIIKEEDLVNAFSMQQGYRSITEEEMLKVDQSIVSILPEDFAKENNVLALNKKDNYIAIAMEDPEDLATLDSIRKLTNLNPEILVAGKSSIESALEILYDKVKKSGEVESAISNITIVKGDEEDGDELDLGTEQVSAEDAPFVKLVNLILTEAIKENSTDVHIEPGRENVNVRIRIDGVLVRIMTPPSNSLNGIVTRLKILSKLNIAEHRLPQDGRMKIKTASRDIDVRVSILPTVHGEKVVLRLLGSGKLSLNLSSTELISPVEVSSTKSNNFGKASQRLKHLRQPLHISKTRLSSSNKSWGLSKSSPSHSIG